ncbi:MAG: TatD family hydrolase [Deltaproteobacteria bacterium]|nr:TatD family hydrolase [Deltaproteobacteria bacterium]
MPRLAPGVAALDSHCHLDEERFAGDRDAVIARALDAGVSTMITIGAGGPMQCNYDAVALATQHAAIFATVGTHPHNASALNDDTLAELEQLAKQPKVIAIGETGLDFYYDHSPRPQQEAAFRRSIALARRVGLPLSIHLRDADGAAAAILRAEHAHEIGGVIHCFSGGPAAARTFLDLGFHLSFSGIATFKAADDIRAAATLTPTDRLLIETDAPFLAPVPCRGRRNEPALVLFTARALAEVRGVALDALAATARANAITLFRLPLS